jgi:hypothetical protein
MHAVLTVVKMSNISRYVLRLTSCFNLQGSLLSGIERVDIAEKRTLDNPASRLEIRTLMEPDDFTGSCVTLPGKHKGPQAWV